MSENEDFRSENIIFEGVKISSPAEREFSSTNHRVIDQQATLE
jgi:hypothetical protein